MIQLSKKFFYAVEAILYIAYNVTTDALSSKEIAEKQGMPPRYLEQMMQRLVHAGVLRGVRGPRGGYRLAREKRRITLADIYVALGDSESPPSSTPLGNQIVVPVLRQCQESLIACLRETTIADLYQRASDKRIAKIAEERNDFII